MEKGFKGQGEIFDFWVSGGIFRDVVFIL